IRTGAILTASPFTLGPYLYLLCYDNDIYVLTARNGHLMTRVRRGHTLDVSSAHAVDHLFAGPFTAAAPVSLARRGPHASGRYAHRARAERAPEVTGRAALADARSHRRLQEIRVLRTTRMLQHHCGAQDRAHRVGDVLAGVPGGGSMHGLEHTDPAGVQVARGSQSEAS